MKQRIHDFFFRYRFPITLFIISKIVLAALCVGIPKVTDHPLHLRAWDASIYLEIAEHGYTFKGEQNRPGIASKNSIAFFPLYPFSIRLLHSLTSLPFLTSGLILSSLFLFLSVIFLYDCALEWSFERTARLTSLFFVFSPGSIFLSAVYSESLFVLWVILTFRSFQRRQYLLASLWIGLATVTRLPGIALLPAFIFEMLKHRVGIKKGSLNILVSTLFLSSFVLYQYYHFGNALAFLDAHSLGWGRHLDWPWRGLAVLWENGPSHPAFHVDLIYLGIVFFVLMSCLKKLPVSFSVYGIGIYFLAICTTWPLSVTRILTTIIPFYLATANLTGTTSAAPFWIGVSIFWSIAGSYFYLIHANFL